MTGPRPDGWVGGSEDFEMVRTLDGHIGVNELTDPVLAGDFEFRRNTRGPGRRDLGGSVYDVSGETEASEGESPMDP